MHTQNEVRIIRDGDRTVFWPKGPMIEADPAPDDLVKVTDQGVKQTMTFQEYKAKYNPP